MNMLRRARANRRGVLAARRLVRREDRPAGLVRPIVAYASRWPKPQQPTILRRKTGRNLMYLVEHGLVNWDGAGNFVQPKRYYRRLDPFTHEVTNEKITDGSPTYGV